MTQFCTRFCGAPCRLKRRRVEFEMSISLAFDVDVNNLWFFEVQCGFRIWCSGVGTLCFESRDSDNSLDKATRWYNLFASEQLQAEWRAWRQRQLSWRNFRDNTIYCYDTIFSMTRWLDTIGVDLITDLMQTDDYSGILNLANWHPVIGQCGSDFKWSG